MFTSGGAAVMLEKNNGVAAFLCQSISHLMEQHCVAHGEDLKIDDEWIEIQLMKELETFI